MFYIGRNGSLAKNSDNSQTQTVDTTNTQVTDTGTSENNTKQADTTSTPPTPVSTTEQIDSGSSIEIINADLTDAQASAVSNYTQIGDQNYNSSLGLARSKNTIFIKHKDKLYYAGSDIFYLSQFTYKGTIYWFYSVQNTDGSQNFYISNPDFKNILSIDGTPAEFIQKIEKVDNSIFDITLNGGNGDYNPKSVRVDVSKVFNNNLINLIS